MKLRLASIACLTLLAASVRSQPIPCPALSHISIANGTYSPQSGVNFQLHPFVATLVPVSKQVPSCFIKMTVVSRATIFISNETLTRVFAEKLGATQSNIKGLKIENGLGKVTLSGQIVKIIPLQFSIAGPVSTDGTDLIVHAESIKADGIPLRLLLGMVGQHLSSVLGLKDVNGIQVEENVLRFSPERIAHLKGYIASAQTTPQGLILRYGKRPAKAAPQTVAGGL